jgi:predicted transposase
VQIVTIKKSQSVFNDIRFIEQYSSVVRFTYNRIMKDKITKASELEHIVKSTMKNIELLDASFIKCAVKKATELNREEKFTLVVRKSSSIKNIIERILTTKIFLFQSEGVNQILLVIGKLHLIF